MGKANRNSHLTIRGEERRRRVLNREIAGPVKSKNELDVIMMKNAVQRDSDKLKFVGPFIHSVAFLECGSYILFCLHYCVDTIIATSHQQRCIVNGMQQGLQ